jgi:hypothetical protein
VGTSLFETPRLNFVSWRWNLLVGKRSLLLSGFGKLSYDISSLSIDSQDLLQIFLTESPLLIEISHCLTQKFQQNFESGTIFSCLKCGMSFHFIQFQSQVFAYLFFFSELFFEMEGLRSRSITSILVNSSVYRFFLFCVLFCVHGGNDFVFS